MEVCCFTFQRNIVISTDEAISVRFLSDRGKHIEKVMSEAQATLRELEARSGHQYNYFKTQWGRQREMQLSIIETSSEKETRERVEELVQLEDRIQEAQ